MGNTSLGISTNQVLTTLLERANRIVIKIGSALVFDPQAGQANALWMTALGNDIAMLRSKGKQIILVSSGAIALGRERLKLGQGSIRLEQKQAAAATGQVELAQKWQSALGAYDIQTAQILLAPEDTETRRRHINARATTTTLLELGVVPVVNENDTITTYEIRFGDNDRLGAALAGLIRADRFVMLTDQDGIFTDDPSKNIEAKLLDLINLDDEDIDLSQQLNSTSGLLGRGGMKTKIEAAKISLNSGADTWVVSGFADNTLLKIFNGEEVGTQITTKKSTLSSRKLWISSFGAVSGTIKLDDGAIEALLRKGKSLLSVGITDVVGDFNKGDLVRCTDKRGNEIATGLINFNNEEVHAIKGLNSEEIFSTLGYLAQAEVIHRNNLVLS